MSREPYGNDTPALGDEDALSPFAPPRAARSLARRRDLQGPEPWAAPTSLPAGETDDVTAGFELDLPGDEREENADGEFDTYDGTDSEFELEHGEAVDPEVYALEESEGFDGDSVAAEDRWEGLTEEDEAYFLDEALDATDADLEYGDPAYESAAPRARCSNLPREVVKCSDVPETRRILCAPDANLRCPPIPELWTSATIDGVPFYYGAVVQAVDGTGGKRLAMVRATNKAYRVRLTPQAWMAAMRWITAMKVFGMPLAAVVTAGAGPYCRCIKRPRGCGERNPQACRGRSPSNHGAGDAIDITGVVWKDPRAVGSSLKVTLVHSWQDAAEQAPLLRRIDAALRLSFATVIDYARSDHRDHFHVDTNSGRTRDVFSESTERWFVAGCLKSLGFITSYGRPPSWSDVQPGLAAFARQINVAVPAAADRNAWRPVVSRLYGCVALGSPLHCKRRTGA